MLTEFPVAIFYHLLVFTGYFTKFPVKKQFFKILALSHFVLIGEGCLECLPLWIKPSQSLVIVMIA